MEKTRRDKYFIFIKSNQENTIDTLWYQLRLQFKNIYLVFVPI